MDTIKTGDTMHFFVFPQKGLSKYYIHDTSTVYTEKSQIEKQ